MNEPEMSPMFHFVHYTHFVVGIFSAHMKEHCVLCYPKARCKDSDQTGRMSILIWVFAVRSGQSLCLFSSATTQMYFLSFI